METSDIITGTKVNEGEIGRGGASGTGAGLRDIRGWATSGRAEQILSSASEKHQADRTGLSEPSEPSSTRWF